MSHLFHVSLCVPVRARAYGCRQLDIVPAQGKAVLSIDLNSIFTVDISAIYNRVEDPVPREDGSVPKSDDLQLVVGLGLELG